MAARDGLPSCRAQLIGILGVSGCGLVAAGPQLDEGEKDEQLGEIALGPVSHELISERLADVTGPVELFIEQERPTREVAGPLFDRRRSPVILKLQGLRDQLFVQDAFKELGRERDAGKCARAQGVVVEPLRGVQCGECRNTSLFEASEREDEYVREIERSPSGEVRFAVGFDDRVSQMSDRLVDVAEPIAHLAEEARRARADTPFARLDHGVEELAIRDRLGVSLPRPTVLRLHREAGGNPLFALELARNLVVAGLPSAAEPWLVPTDVQEVVAARIGLLPNDVRAALLTAAASSQPTIGALSASAIKAAVTAEIVTVAEDGRVRFAHPLYASAVFR